jgi:hypothetical protein
MRITNRQLAKGAALLAATAFVPLMVSAAPQAGDQVKPDTPIDWLQEPSSEILEAAMPKAAMDKHVNGGKAVIRCHATVVGTLGSCVVVSESPANMGFGAAALTMAPQFLFRPATKNGKPIETIVTIPVGWAMSAGTTVGTNVARGDMSVDTHAFYSHVQWTATPSYAEVVAAYPAKAKTGMVGGSAILQCAFKDEGRLSGCAVQSDKPTGYGFGNAALTLTNRFQAPSKTADGKSTKGAFVTVSVFFTAGMLDGTGVYVTAAPWVASPTPEMFARGFPAKARAAGVTSSRVVLSCLVGSNGALTDCSVKEENPADLGFGEASLALAPQFVMKLWGDDGQPMVGRRINLPVRYQMQVKAASNAPASPPTP